MQVGVLRLACNAVRPPPSQMACPLLTCQNTFKQSSSSFNEVLSSVLIRTIMIVLLSPQDRSQKVNLLMELPVLTAIQLKNRQERWVKEALIGQTYITHMLCTSLMLFLACLKNCCSNCKWLKCQLDFCFLVTTHALIAELCLDISGTAGLAIYWGQYSMFTPIMSIQHFGSQIVSITNDYKRSCWYLDYRVVFALQEESWFLNASNNFSTHLSGR